MSPPIERWREVPPTAGMPLGWRDFMPARTQPLSIGMAEFLGATDVQMTCSGTAALIIALTALHRLSGRRSVVVPAYTCPLVALAVLHCGLRLRICDVRPGHFNLDPARLAALCDADTLAVLPTHLAGRVADVDAARQASHAVGAFVIEDAAQALGARHGDRSVGLLGDVGFFSLAAGKGLTTYEGGALVAADPAVRVALRETANRIAPMRRARELQRMLQLLGYGMLYRPRALRAAYGWRLRRALRREDPVAAVGDDFDDAIPLHPLGAWRQAVAARALPRLPAFQHALSDQARQRLPRLLALPGVRVLQDHDDARGAWPFFFLLMPTRAARDAALRRLWTAGLGVSRLFIHALPDYAYLAPRISADGPSNGTIPNARDFAARSLTISNSLWLQDAPFDAICIELAAAATHYPA
jgi:dTDP-4-amino-4,6-dideoxygalactose transaminase